MPTNCQGNEQMSLTSEDITNIAQLAKLNVSPIEQSQLQQNLDNTLELVKRMSAIDISDIQPMAHPLDANQPLREDRVTEIDQHEAFQAIAPNTAAGLYIVPKVIETK